MWRTLIIIEHRTCIIQCEYNTVASDTAAPFSAVAWPLCETRKLKTRINTREPAKDIALRARAQHTHTHTGRPNRKPLAIVRAPELTTSPLLRTRRLFTVYRTNIRRRQRRHAHAGQLLHGVHGLEKSRVKAITTGATAASFQQEKNKIIAKKFGVFICSWSDDAFAVCWLFYLSSLLFFWIISRAKDISWTLTAVRAKGVWKREITKKRQPSAADSGRVFINDCVDSPRASPLWLLRFIRKHDKSSPQPFADQLKNEKN